MADGKNNGVTLTGKQRDKLRELELENVRLSQVSEAAKKSVLEKAQERRSEARRSSTDIVKLCHDDYVKQKADLDGGLKEQEKLLRKDYERKVERLKSERKKRYEEEERLMEGNLAEAEAWEAGELQKIVEGTDGQIRDILAAKNEIIKAAAASMPVKKKSKKEKDSTPVEVPSIQPETVESADDCTDDAVGEEKSGEDEREEAVEDEKREEPDGGDDAPG